MSLILERAQLIDIVNDIIPQSTTIPKLIEWKNKDSSHFLLQLRKLVHTCK